jgi:hypothetical protein
MLRILLLALSLSLLPLSSALAAREDIVVLINGDDVTGEIKSLEFGSMRYKTDSMGTVNIDWEDVVRLTSPQSLQVELEDGDRYFGTLGKAEEDYHVAVITPSATYQFASSEIIRITPIDTSQRFIDRVDGSISAGFTSQKSTEVTTFNLASEFSYRTTAYALSLTANTSLTEQPERENSERLNTSLSYQKFRPNRWFADWYSTYEVNDELGVLGRFSIGGAYGRYVIQSNSNLLSLTAGVQATSERVSDSENSESVPEGRIQLRYQHRNPAKDGMVRLTATAFPLIEQPDIFRAETDLTFRRELVDDLDLDISFWHSYQSNPPVDAANSDYGVTTSIALSF